MVGAMVFGALVEGEVQPWALAPGAPAGVSLEGVDKVKKPEDGVGNGDSSQYANHAVY